jgi:hypothetical protein
VPTKLSQGQAARAAGVSRTTIWRAMKDGRLSYEKGADGSFQIDLSELVRVFPDADVGRTRTGTRAGEPNMQGAGHANEFNGLRELVQELKEDKARLQGELDRAAEERKRLLAMLERQTEHVRLLTDQRATEPQRSWLTRWFSRRATPAS